MVLTGEQGKVGSWGLEVRSLFMESTNRWKMHEASQREAGHNNRCRCLRLSKARHSKAEAEGLKVEGQRESGQLREEGRITGVYSTKRGLKVLKLEDPDG